jgi:hypothetical protein
MYDILILPVVNYPARGHADSKAPPIAQVEKFCELLKCTGGQIITNELQWDKHCTLNRSMRLDTSLSVSLVECYRHSKLAF